MSSVRRRLAGLACLPLLVLSACSDDPPSSSAEPTPTVTASVDPTPTQTPETPRDRVPEKAREQSRAGAIAFAKYWVKVLNRTLSSLDTEDLRELSGEACQSCTDMADDVDALVARGGTFQGGRSKVQRASALPHQAPGEEIVELALEVAREVRLEAEGARRIVAPASERSISMELRWHGGGWLVTSLGLRK